MIGVFAGTFDPPTMGHLDLIERAASICEKLYVLAAVNAAKHPAFELDARLNWLRQACGHLDNVQVEAAEGAAALWANSRGAQVLFRGIRSGQDADYEAGIAWVNNRIRPEIQTIALFAKPEYAHLSSTSVRELYRLGMDLTGLVPEGVLADLQPEKTGNQKGEQL